MKLVVDEEERSECDKALQESTSRILETAKQLDSRTEGLLVIRFIRKTNERGQTLRGTAYYPAGVTMTPSELLAMIEATCLKT